MRCITSGRLAPAAATFTSTSPSAGGITGRCSGTSISGPPGERMAITVMLVGMVLMRLPYLKDCRFYNRRHGHASVPATITRTPKSGLPTDDSRLHHARTRRHVQREPPEDRAVRFQLLVRPSRDHGAGALVGELGRQSQARPHGRRRRPRFHAADRALEGLWRRYRLPGRHARDAHLGVGAFGLDQAH